MLNVKDKQYLFSSYNGSKVKREGLETNQVIYTIKKKNFRIEIAIQNNFITLLSPKKWLTKSKKVYPENSTQFIWKTTCLFILIRASTLA